MDIHPSNQLFAIHAVSSAMHIEAKILMLSRTEITMVSATATNEILIYDIQQ